MRCAILGLVGGVAWLQAQAVLPEAATQLACISAAMLAAAGSAWLMRRAALNASQRLATFFLLLRAGLAAAAGALVGFAWAAFIAQASLSNELAKSDEGHDFDIVGTIDSLPNRQDGSTRFNFAVESPSAVPPRIVLSWYAGTRAGNGTPPPELLPGERWRLKVRLQRPHGNANPHGFDYELWLLEQDIRATGYVRAEGRNERLSGFVPSAHNAVERARYAIRQHINAALPDARFAPVIAALAMGDQRGISQQDWQVFSRTGISHLVSISGLHITMIAGLVAWVVGCLWRKSFFMPEWQLPLLMPAARLAVIAGFLAAWGYVALAGFGVPAQRTLYMLAVVAIAVWLDRVSAISHVLALAAGVVVILDPWAVMWPGFWLSFGAVAAILYATVGRVSPSGAAESAGALPAAPADTATVAQEPASASWRNTAWLARTRESLRLAARTQLAVTVGLVPLTMLLFSQVSLVSPLANAIAIPIISLLVTPLALAGSVLPDPLAAPVLQCAHWVLEALLELLQWLSVQSHAVWSAPAPSWPVFAFALAGTAWMLAPRGWPLRWLGLACWLPLLSAQPDSPQPGELRAVAFDVGQGMAVLIETGKHRLLYDTGPAYTPETNGGNRVILPYLRQRGIARLDGMVVSHGDTDHSGGALAVLGEQAVDWVASSLAPGHPVARAAKRHLQCAAGQRWEWDGVRFEMLHPAAASYAEPGLKANARSCTLKITNGRTAILLAGDIEAAQEAELVLRGADQLRADVLLAPHHGSGTSSTAVFLAAVRPSVAIFQVGWRNRYHHPKETVWMRYGELGIRRVRTDEEGAVVLAFGDRVDVATWRAHRPRYWYGR
ncbi:MAG TPA: DNA internalization-related competence protein ComEC/Rec2 [Pseudoduganella sp.]